MIAESSIPPSLTPIFTKPGVKPKASQHQGKILEVVYDWFGDLQGFVLKECCGEQRFFECCERSAGDRGRASSRSVLITCDSGSAERSTRQHVT